MKITLRPQVREKEKLWYEIKHQVLTITHKGLSDTFDFRDMPDGELELYDEKGNFLIESSLEEVPIVSARKEKGILFIEFIFSIDEDEDDEELLFPKEMTLTQFNKLMERTAIRRAKRKEEKEKKEKEKNDEIRRNKEIIDRKRSQANGY